MSIASAITTAQGKVAAAYTSCNSKGATMPTAANQNLSNLATTVSSISTGTPFNQTIQKWVVSNGVYSTDEENVGTTSTIANRKFYMDTTIVAALIPDTITILDNQSFRGCTNLKYVNLENVEDIYSEAFLDSGLQTLNAPNLTTVRGQAFRGSALETVESMGSITSLDREFWGCSSLKSAVLPNTLTTIGQNTFYNCTSLISITGLTNVTTLGTNAFRGCSSLNIEISLPNLTSIGSGAFYGSAIDKVLDLGRIETIPSDAFRDCSVTSVALPSTIKTLSDRAFYNCTSLATVTGLEYVETLGNAFAICNNLSIEVNMPNLTTMTGGFGGTKITKVLSLGSLTTVPYQAFRECRSLTTVVLPSTITALGQWAFLYDSALTSLTIYATTPPTYGNNCLTGVSSNIVIYVPSESVSAYQSASGWSAFAAKIQAIPS